MAGVFPVARCFQAGKHYHRSVGETSIGPQQTKQFNTWHVRQTRIQKHNGREHGVGRKLIEGGAGGFGDCDRVGDAFLAKGAEQQLDIGRAIFNDQDTVLWHGGRLYGGVVRRSNAHRMG